MYGHPYMGVGFRVTIRPIQRQGYRRPTYQVVTCAPGIFQETKKVWPQPYDAKHWVLNLAEPRKVGTFINPRNALFPPKR